MSVEEFLFPLPSPRPDGPARKFKDRNPIWTECKAKLIERYLHYFVIVTHHGTYIDGFAGPQEPDKPEMWSAKLVLESQPRWLKNFSLFEIDGSKLRALERLKASQPPPDKHKKEQKRRVEIYGGDFNQNILRVLADSPIREKEATFCLLDQHTFECNWNSVRALATHKKGGNKIELFYFFPEGWLNRSIKALKIQKEDRLLKWWGRPDWGRLLEMRGAARAAYVCERFKREFGYKQVYPFAIYAEKSGGRIMYYMIHASDHTEAPLLMSRAYGKALDIKETQEQMDLIRDDLDKQLMAGAQPK